MLANLQVGAVARGPELGYEGSKGKRRFIQAECPSCGVMRFVDYQPPYRAGMMRRCQECQRNAIRTFNLGPGAWDYLPEGR